jgi:hypothetical protein
MEGLIVLGIIVALNLFALVYGKDSRDSNDWVNHRPV